MDRAGAFAKILLSGMFPRGEKGARAKIVSKLADFFAQSANAILSRSAKFGGEWTDFSSSSRETRLTVPLPPPPPLRCKKKKRRRRRKGR